MLIFKYQRGDVVRSVTDNLPGVGNGSCGIVVRTVKPTLFGSPTVIVLFDGDVALECLDYQVRPPSADYDFDMVPALGLDLLGRVPALSH